MTTTKNKNIVGLVSLFLLILVTICLPINIFLRFIIATSIIDVFWILLFSNDLKILFKTFKEDKKHLLITIVISIAIGIYGYLSVNSKLYPLFFTMLFILFSLVIFVALLYPHYKSKAFVLFMELFLGLSLSIMIPIGAVPDEVQHINHSYNLSNKLLGVEILNEGMYMRSDDLQQAEQSYARGSYYSTDTYLSYFDSYTDSLKDSSLSQKNITNVANLSFSSIVYIFTAIGISIGRLLSFNTYTTLLLGRMFNFLFFLITTSYAYALIKSKKAMFLVLLLFPMTIQQGMSYSYDCIINALSFLLLAKMSQMDANPSSIKKIEYPLLAFVSFILFIVKSGAYFLIGLAPWIFLLLKKIHLNKKQKKILFISLLSIFIVMVGVYLYYINSIKLDYTLNACQFGECYSVSYFIQNPFRFVEMLFVTLKNTWIDQVVLVIGQELAWMDMTSCFKCTIMFALLFLVSSFTYDEIKPTKKLKATALFVGITTIIFIYAGMAVSWTTFNQLEIDGVQGRYFTPILLFLFLFTSCKIEKFKFLKPEYLLFVGILCNIFNEMYILSSL